MDGSPGEAGVNINDTTGEKLLGLCIVGAAIEKLLTPERKVIELRRGR